MSGYRGTVEAEVNIDAVPKQFLVACSPKPYSMECVRLLKFAVKPC